jgi:hypothetical protein
VEACISLVCEDRVAVLDSLADWLRTEPNWLAGSPIPALDLTMASLGRLGNALVAAVASYGTLSVLAASLKVWPSRPRGSIVWIRLEVDDGRVVAIKVDRMDRDRDPRGCIDRPGTRWRNHGE